MKKTFLILLFLSFILSCNKIVEKPKNLIDEDKMAEIITDLTLYRQASYLIEANLSEDQLNTLDTEIMSRHNINPKDFLDSYKYYVLNTEKFQEILQKSKTILESKLPEDELERMKSQNRNKK